MLGYLVCCLLLFLSLSFVDLVFREYLYARWFVCYVGWRLDLGWSLIYNQAKRDIVVIVIVITIIVISILIITPS